MRCEPVGGGLLLVLLLLFLMLFLLLFLFLLFLVMRVTVVVVVAVVVTVAVAVVVVVVGHRGVRACQKKRAPADAEALNCEHVRMGLRLRSSTGWLWFRAPPLNRAEIQPDSVCG